LAFKFSSFFDPESIADVGAFADNLVSSPSFVGMDRSVQPLRYYVAVGTTPGSDNVLPLQAYDAAVLTPNSDAEAGAMANATLNEQLLAIDASEK